MSRITQLLFEQPVSETTGLWSGDDPADLTFRSWAQVRSTAAKAAAGLARAGVDHGSSVAILAGGAADVAVLVQATWMRGAAFTMLHQPTPRTNLETWVEDTRAVIRMLDARVLVVAEPFTDAVRGLDLGVVIVPVDEILTAAPEQAPVPTGEDDIAVLQLTSGTTGVPKAVAISYRNLHRNQQAMVSAAGFRPDDVAVSWLPLYHDMGMVGLLMTPIFAQATTVVITPLAFLKNPLSWAELITRFRGTFTAAPNFAYSVLARRLRRAADGAYDLSSLRVCVNGAEAVDESTLREFIDEAARFGLRPESLMPAYGMAETTLAVSFTGADAMYSVDIVDADLAERDGIIGREPAARSRTLMRLGVPVPGIELRVVDESGVALPADRIGTLLVRGDAVTTRYLGPDGYVSAVDADGWLSTGDLGYLTENGEAVVTGRKKDVIIVAGRNISPVVVERAAVGIAGVRPGSVAALAVRLPSMAREGIAVIAESDAADDVDECERIRKEVARAVFDDVGIAPAVVTVVRKGALPKTPSGKLRRASAASLIPS
ncbi:long-chain-fatty-acid--CoA ligase [Nocardia sp. NBC_01329]|uniref:long-chain-fatty-acid--CoA ligase n=1 Tax=Nocardia sp. NBC_01329 TaxID=2903594 RepID=UPI002E0FF1F9|nr:long-chain-fatty-acid--CoA ligase [Nocardia sp. NBC_01329]